MEVFVENSQSSRDEAPPSASGTMNKYTISLKGQQSKDAPKITLILNVLKIQFFREILQICLKVHYFMVHGHSAALLQFSVKMFNRVELCKWIANDFA